MSTRKDYLFNKERLFTITQTHNLQIFRGNLLCQATKRHLNNSLKIKNDEKLDEKRNNFSFLCVFVCVCVFWGGDGGGGVELLFSCPVLGRIWVIGKL